ncbi:MAG: siroheme synthase CysG [Pseudobdellovibrionaceae bacterium]
MTAVLPLFLKQQDPVLIVGGGAIATAKAEVLENLKIKIHVVAKEIHPGLKKLLSNGGHTFNERSFIAEDLKAVKVLVVATNNHELNHQIYDLAKTKGILVNVVDDSNYCDFTFPALVSRGPLHIAISSSGISPVLTRVLKYKIEQIIPSAFERVLEFAEQKKQQVKVKLKSIQSRRLFWQQVLDGPIAEEILENNKQKAEQLFIQSLADHPEHPKAALYLIGAGCGHADLITVKGARLLSLADVILYDRLVATDLLDSYARKDAEKILVGKTKDFHLKTQSDIDSMLEHYLLQKKIVVRLKGGDPSLYAHAAEEIAVACRLGVPYQIVPGITAALGCAATAGFPLTERGGADSVRILTLSQDKIYDEVFWRKLRYCGPETLVFYMSTVHRSTLCEKLQQQGWPQNTPMLTVEQGATPYHREQESTLENFMSMFGDRPLASPTLIVVGEVIKWRSYHGWKESSQENVNFFPELKSEYVR